MKEETLVFQGEVKRLRFWSKRIVNLKGHSLSYNKEGN